MKITFASLSRKSDGKEKKKKKTRMAIAKLFAFRTNTIIDKFVLVIDLEVVSSTTIFVQFKVS